MANKRMISKSLSTSLKFNSLKTDRVRLLFVLMIPHCDDWGRMDGEPAVVRAIVRPMTQKYSIDDCGVDISDLNNAGLLSHYEVDNKKVIEICQWFEHQTITENKRTKSRFPKNSQESPGIPKNLQNNITQAKLTKDKIRPGLKQYPDDSFQIKLSLKLKDQILIFNPQAKITETQIKNWCRIVDLMVARDKRKYLQIFDILDVIDNDSFWRKNILSMGKLREKWNEGRFSTVKNNGASGVNDPEYMKGLKVL